MTEGDGNEEGSINEAAAGWSMVDDDEEDESMSDAAAG